jgi:hypothetical protein
VNADQISKLLDDLATKLTPAAQHVFDLAMRAQISSTVLWVVATGVIALALAITSLWLNKKRTADSKDNRYSSDYELPLMFSGMVCGVTVILLFYFVISAIYTLTNIEWVTLQSLASAITGK